MVLNTRKTTTTIYVVSQIQSSGKHQDLEQPVIMSNLQGVSQKKAY